MINKETRIRESIEIVLENALSRIYISNLNAKNRNAIYSEFKEWIEAKDNYLERGDIIYSNYRR
tara:strand:- start:484 stop:675 length:192 start_codon:yes stop_codon:yes gene_type:complete